MPFTPAHTVIVLPLINGRYFSATALIVGAMAPDFEYFLKMSVSGVHGHTWAGLLYFDLPMTVGLSMIYHEIVKKNLITNFPSFLQRRFASALFFDFKNSLKRRPVTFAASAIIGSASHIFWDGFTHGDGFFVKTLPFYVGAHVYFDGVNYPLWYALQHISTFTGLTVIALVVLFKKALDFPEQKVSVGYWASFFVIAMGIVGLRFLIYSKDYNLGNLVVSSMTAICLSLIICGLIRFRSTQELRVF